MEDSLHLADHTVEFAMRTVRVAAALNIKYTISLLPRMAKTAADTLLAWLPKFRPRLALDRGRQRGDDETGQASGRQATAAERGRVLRGRHRRAIHPNMVRAARVRAVSSAVK